MRTSFSGSRALAGPTNTPGTFFDNSTCQPAGISMVYGKSLSSGPGRATRGAGPAEPVGTAGAAAGGGAGGAGGAPRAGGPARAPARRQTRRGARRPDARPADSHHTRDHLV